VERAEQAAHAYHAFLQTVGEADEGPLRVCRREWFLASPSFVTVHICFEAKTIPSESSAPRTSDPAAGPGPPALPAG
jgi:hypothetical protein